ncbi:hypothetical protein BDP81DRAFT_413037 [Colletotrichum phormii]|uniref:Secreted protein n=1 Tax=Colletotrichum phormii TaxID=359342 RepID=A0AAJ0ENJ0_9PEZI|nr:uncharacterized protein BDP81DRAFT_413037 [Colletotrichum phormii]KAK1655624.1 hypothetical protein BDP81DRAFT_413037 [Colletotrichum phormii]
MCSCILQSVRVALVCLGLKAWSRLLKIIGGPSSNCKGDATTNEIIDERQCSHGHVFLHRVSCRVVLPAVRFFVDLHGPGRFP